MKFLWDFFLLFCSFAAWPDSLNLADSVAAAICSVSFSVLSSPVAVHAVDVIIHNTQRDPFSPRMCIIR